MTLSAENLTRTFVRDGRESNIFYAVRDVSLTLAGGALTELVGRSGSGKTTLINMLCGLLRPSSGRVLLDGTDLYVLSDGARARLRGKNIGVIPQGQTGLDSLTVMENILIPAAMAGADTPETRRRAEALLERMDILSLKNVYSNELSGGEMRRMAIARALVLSPDIIVADEPTADLDEDTTRLVLTLLKDEARRGAAVMMVTHEDAALPYADRVYKMDKGILVDQESGQAV